MLSWAKWKRDNPVTTALDAKIRISLLNDETAYWAISNATGIKRQIYMSPEQRREIANHLWLLEAPVQRNPKPRTLILRWGTKSQFHLISISNNNSPRDTVSEMFIGSNFAQTTHQLHPASSHYLRQWLAKHPLVEKILTSKYS